MMFWKWQLVFSRDSDLIDVFNRTHLFLRSKIGHQHAIMPADDLAPNGARPSAGMVMVAKLDIFFS